MAEKKTKNDETKEKSVTQVKATTGAWWKSTTSVAEEGADNREGEKSDTAVAVNSDVSPAEDEPQEKKPKPRGRRKKKTVLETADVAESSPAAPPEQNEKADKTEPKKTRTTKPRAPRRKKSVSEAVREKASVASGSENAPDSVPADAVQKESVNAEGSSAQAVQSGASSDVGTPAPSTQAREDQSGTRSGLPTAQNTSEKAVGAAGADAAVAQAQDVAVTVGDAVGDTVVVEASQVEVDKPVKPKRKRRPRKPKTEVKADPNAVNANSGETNVSAQVEGDKGALSADSVASKEVPASSEGDVTSGVDVPDLEVSGSSDAAPSEGSEEPKKPKSRRSRGKRGGRKKDKGDKADLGAKTEKDSTAEISDDAQADELTSAKGEIIAEEPVDDESWDEGTERDNDDVSDDFDADADSALSDDDSEDESSEEDDDTTVKEESQKVCKLLINAEEPEECRLALLEDGRLESIHVSTIGRTQTKNNIYKAKIVAIEPSLQAAFVDYGTEKNGFLPFSEIHPEYYRQDLSEDVARLVEAQQWKKLNITDVMVRGQEILAQVVKEEVGKKGANMTTFLSIPGRCVVLMPGSDSAGISRKISGEQRRTELRDTMNSLDLPEGIGWIVRTASVDITQKALQRDVGYLLKLWEEIKKKGQDMDGVGLIYEDQQSVLRFLREHFDPNIEEILVDDRTALEQVKTFIEMLPEGHRNVRVRLHQGARPIFNQYSVEDQIESIYQPQVNLPSGGSIVIEPTEALVSIDVNSGSTSKGKNFEASIFQANMEAAAELARQLRLRDLGGLIVVDFIDMRSKKHILAVEKQVRASMKKDKAKVDFSRISKFGLMQISRQKLGSPIEAGNYRRCEHCKGRGAVRSVETLSLYYLRRIQTGASRKQVERIEGHFPLDVATYLQNNKRNELNDMETRYKVEIAIIGNPTMRPVDHELIYHKKEKEVQTKK